MPGKAKVMSGGNDVDGKSGNNVGGKVRRGNAFEKQRSGACRAVRSAFGKLLDACSELPQSVRLYSLFYAILIYRDW